MLYSQCTQAPARDTADWRTSHFYENQPYTFETDLYRANRFHAVHPASRHSQEQTVGPSRP